MKSNRFALAALVLALLFPASVLAWNDTGHKLVAAIAWDNMTPAARTKAIELLKKAPADACLLDLFPNDTRPLADRQREFFMRAATWPDVVRPDGDNDPRKCTRFHQRDWHFIDHFWTGVSGETGSNAPKDKDIDIPDINAVDRLAAFRQSVPCEQALCPAARSRARHLAWILHLVGDIHQPLHTAAHVTAQSPNGDQGGNGFTLAGSPSKLHSYWDGIIDKKLPPNPGEKQIDYLNRVEARIVSDHPRAGMVSRIHSGDFNGWALEGFETAKSRLYPKTLKMNQVPSDTYRDMAFDIGDEAIALGGYRLADLLNHMLVP
ncbi:MAG TPA: S1/P1 nuclease [Thermoanaerobaculia bacterium]|nr:S1/P1 nuclease [Thermoanaerobaculia bacterium]